MTNIKGYEFKQIIVRDSYNRRAVQFKNKMVDCLKTAGVIEDDIDIPLEQLAMRKIQASISWYMWRKHLFFSYNGSSKFVENVAMVAQVIEHFVNLLKEKEINQEEFLNLFVEDEDIIKQRIKAREILGVKENSTDFKEIHENYKNLSKEHHPDMPSGSTEQFKKINAAHKILKKELD